MTETTKVTTSEAALDLMIDTDQLKLDVEIDSANLTGNMQSHSSMYVHYATKTQRARRQHDRWKSALEVLESSLESSHRSTLRDEYEAAIAADPKSKAKAPTEAQIRAAVVTDPKWRAASSQVIEAAHVYRLCEVAERAFEHRKDMLLQIARDASREQSGGPMRVLANQNAQASREVLLQAMGRNATESA